MYISFWTTSEPAPGRPLEQRCVLEHGRRDRPVAVEVAQPLDLRRDAPPQRLLVRHHVVRATGTLDPGALAHGASARSSARNGLRASSPPSVVIGPWPGYTTVSAGSALGERPDRGEQRLPVRAGEVGTPHRAGEEDVAREEAVLRVVGDVVRGVPRHREHLERDVRDLDRVPARDEHLRRVRADGDSGGRVRALRALEQGALPLGHVHRRPGSLGEVGDAEQVVEVAVRDEDPRAARPEPSERQPQLGRVAARIDDRCLRRAGVAADDVAVRPHRTERELVDAKPHRPALSFRGGRPAVARVPDAGGTSGT